MSKGQYPLPGPRVEGGGGGVFWGVRGSQKTIPPVGSRGVRWQGQHPCKGSGVELVVRGQYPSGWDVLRPVNHSGYIMETLREGDAKGRVG